MKLRVMALLLIMPLAVLAQDGGGKEGGGNSSALMAASVGHREHLPDVAHVIVLMPRRDTPLLLATRIVCVTYAPTVAANDPPPEEGHALPWSAEAALAWSSPVATATAVPANTPRAMALPEAAGQNPAPLSPIRRTGTASASASATETAPDNVTRTWHNDIGRYATHAAASPVVVRGKTYRPLFPDRDASVFAASPLPQPLCQ
jgi:hypothetical protein